MSEQPVREMREVDSGYGKARDRFRQETAMRRNFSLLRWFNWRDMARRHRGLNYFVNAYYTRPRLNPVSDTWKELRFLCHHRRLP